MRFLSLAAIMLLSGACSSKKDSTPAVSSPILTLKGSGSATASLAVTDSNGNNIITPTSARMTIYEFWAATKDDCSSPIKVYSNSEGKTVDMMASPDIGSGPLAAGTYNCVILVMSDSLKFSNAATVESCTGGVEHTLDVFGPHGEGSVPTSILPDGSSVTATAGNDKFAVYLSTLSTSDGSGGQDGMHPPTGDSDKDSKGFKLSAPLVVSGDKTGTIYMDTTNKLKTTDNCDLNPPLFGFR